MLLTWCYGLTHHFSLPRATGCLHSSDREKTVSRNAWKRYVSERACFYIPKGEKPRNFMGLEAKSYSTINKQVLPVHRLSPQALPSLLTLSMEETGAADKPKYSRWERRNLLWEGEFEYFDHSGG